MMGKAGSEHRAIIIIRPQLFAELIPLRNVPEHAIAGVVREVVTATVRTRTGRQNST